MKYRHQHRVLFLAKTKCNSLNCSIYCLYNKSISCTVASSASTKILGLSLDICGKVHVNSATLRILMNYKIWYNIIAIGFKGLNSSENHAHLKLQARKSWELCAHYWSSGRNQTYCMQVGCRCNALSVNQLRLQCGIIIRLQYSVIALWGERS